MAARDLGQLSLVVIVGPTASGKTSLAIEMAEQFGGEIICADSRTIYKDMDVGTAKPTSEERARVSHWGLDLVEPGERFTAADFKRYAEEKITEIRARGHVPFLVGGTGLYVDAVLFNYQFGGKVNSELRSKLEKMSVSELQAYCIENNIELPENDQNKRYLVRAIERKNHPTTSNIALIDNTLVVGIATDRSVLRKRIEGRAEQIFDDGVVEEATLLGKKYGWDGEAMTGNVYPLIHLYLRNEATLAEIKDKFTTLDWRLAKRQLTWLRRNPHVHWLELPEAKQYITEVLANE